MKQNTSKIVSPQKSELAHKYFTNLKQLVKQQSVLFLDTGRILKVIRDEKYYEHLDYESWTAFLGDNQIGIGQSTAYAYIGIYEEFVMKYGFSFEILSEVPWYKLQYILPSVRRSKDITEVKEYFDKAKSLSRSDLAIEVNEKVEEGVVTTKLVKAFYHDKCKKYRLQGFSPEDVCKCKD